jgi:hypothetical protein
MDVPSYPKAQFITDADRHRPGPGPRDIIRNAVDMLRAFGQLRAISRAAAKIRKIASPVAGDADILACPDLEAGNMLAKQLSYLAHADSAGIVLGARVPVILTSRADSVTSRRAPVALAQLLVAARGGKAGMP